MLTRSAMTHSARRFLAPGLAVVLGVAFVAATLALSASLNASLRELVAGTTGRYAVIVTPAENAGSVPAATAEQIMTLPGVEKAKATREAILAFGVGGGPARVTTATPDTVVKLLNGHLPTRPDEIAVTQGLADFGGWQVGARVPVSDLATGTAAGRGTVVGIVDVRGDPDLGQHTFLALATDKTVSAWSKDSGYAALALLARSGTSPEDLRTAVAAVAGARAVVQTGEEAAAARLESVDTGQAVLTAVLLSFAAIALFVSSFVIANTFTILMARRARETALLRCVGATRAQVVRSSLKESSALAVLFSGLGVVAGFALSGLLIWIVNRTDVLEVGSMSLAVTPVAVIVPWVAGVVVMVAASLLPVLRASKVTPLAALRPDAAVTAGTRAGRVRLTIGFVLLLLGSGLLWVGVHFGTLLAAVPGGMLVSLGVLLVGTLLVPWVVAGIGRLGRPARSVPFDLAVDNTLRNPARAASTASALVIGVTLIAMNVTGGACALTTANALLDKEFAVDLSVTSRAGELPKTALTRLRSISGVTDAAAVPGARLTVGTQKDQIVMGIPTTLEGVVHDKALLAAYREGVMVVPSRSGHRAGERIVVTGPAGSRTFTTAVADGLDHAWALTATDLATVAGPTTAYAVVLRADPRADVGRLIAQTQRVATGLGEVEVGGSAPERAQIEQALSITLAIVSALLGISVLIAIVGIGNTLALSVHERQRESAVLRALGVTRGQLKGMLAAEGVTLAVVAALIGSVLGVALGILGVKTVFRSAGFDTLIALPWGQLGLIAGCALLAGLIASVLPGRRAARIAPAAALAAD